MEDLASAEDRESTSPGLTKVGPGRPIVPFWMLPTEIRRSIEDAHPEVQRELRWFLEKANELEEQIEVH